MPTVNLWLKASLGRLDNEKNVYVCFGSGGTDVEALPRLIIGFTRGLGRMSRLQSIPHPPLPHFKKSLSSFSNNRFLLLFRIFISPPALERMITVTLITVLTTQIEKEKK